MVFFVCSTSCNKEDDNTPVIKETGTMTDIDGNVYKTIKIGNQWWMAENLKVGKFRNGTFLRLAASAAEWADSTHKPAYCIYDNNNTAPGCLYNWQAVSDTNQLAPEGWHIPSDDEWKELERYVGMSAAEAGKVGWRGAHEGEKLKIQSPQNWTDFEGVWSTNESGFSALAGSCRLHDGSWGDPGLAATGFWWTSGSYSGEESWYRYLDYKNANVFRSHCNSGYGFSVRCVKNQ